MEVAIVTARIQDVDVDVTTSEDGGMRNRVAVSGQQKLENPRTSYKDSFLGNGPPPEEEEDFGDALMSDESEGEDAKDDPFCPMIQIKKKTDARVRRHWGRAITFWILGKTLPFAFVQRRILSMWAKTGGVKMGDIGKKYFQAMFDSQLDYNRALYGGRGRLAITMLFPSRGGSILIRILILSSKPHFGCASPDSHSHISMRKSSKTSKASWAG
ncbi:unnamed protein product [Linum trigynum]|uniref:Uncharacterized protein n=1 Tax=Linum trigynum TaxID=586398 RepID=A0AAV2FKD3_9ROSI